MNQTIDNVAWADDDHVVFSGDAGLPTALQVLQVLQALHLRPNVGSFFLFIFATLYILRRHKLRGLVT